MTIEQLTTLVQVVQDLSLSRDLESLIKTVRTAARKLTGADGATFVLRENNLCYYVDEDAISPLWKGQKFPMSACISGWSMLNKKSAVIPDIYVDERIPIDAYEPTFVKSLAMVPIRTSDPLGAIGNYWAEKHEPTTEEVKLLQSLADITSVSIANVYSYSKLVEQNKQLYDIAVMQSHQVRAPITTIKGLVAIFNKQNMADPVNTDVINKISEVTDQLDSVIRQIVSSTEQIEIENN